MSGPEHYRIEDRTLQPVECDLRRQRIEQRITDDPASGVRRIENVAVDDPRQGLRMVRLAYGSGPLLMLLLEYHNRLLAIEQPGAKPLTRSQFEDLLARRLFGAG